MQVPSGVMHCLADYGGVFIGCLVSVCAMCYIYGHGRCGYKQCFNFGPYMYTGYSSMPHYLVLKYCMLVTIHGECQCHTMVDSQPAKCCRIFLK